MAKSRLVAIVGPTASGKSSLGVRLAKQFDGEIVSGDSRQVYRGLDIGSGKITKKEMMGIPHHLLDVASPKHTFSVAQYQRRAFHAIASITRKNKLPFLVGGSPFYIYSVVDGIVFPEVKPNPKLRWSLARLSNQELLEKLRKLDPERAKTIEQKNKRRLVRALEIVMTTGKPVPELHKITPLFDVLMIGIKRSPEELKKRIRKRLLHRLNPRTSASPVQQQVVYGASTIRGRHGMINEVRHLRKSGLSWKRLEGFGLEYRYVAQYLQEKISYAQMLRALEKAINDFARRQMTWFKRDPRIQWIKTQQEAEGLVKKLTQEMRTAIIEL